MDCFQSGFLGSCPLLQDGSQRIEAMIRNGKVDRQRNLPGRLVGSQRGEKVWISLSSAIKMDKFSDPLFEAWNVHSKIVDVVSFGAKVTGISFQLIYLIRD